MESFFEVFILLGIFIIGGVMGGGIREVAVAQTLGYSMPELHEAKRECERFLPRDQECIFVITAEVAE